MTDKIEAITKLRDDFKTLYDECYGTFMGRVKEGQVFEGIKECAEYLVTCEESLRVYDLAIKVLEENPEIALDRFRQEVQDYLQGDILVSDVENMTEASLRRYVAYGRGISIKNVLAVLEAPDGNPE